MRNLLLLLLALIVIGWLRRALSRKKPPDAHTRTQQPNQTAEPMRVCAYCGIHVPESEGIWETTGETAVFFCSKTHQQLGPRFPKD